MVRPGVGQQDLQKGIIWGASLVSFLPQHPEAAFSMEKGNQGLATLLLGVKVTFITWLVWG